MKHALTVFIFLVISFGELLHFGELSGNYSLYIPSQNSNTLIVTLHGSGERSNMFIDNWLKEAQKFNLFILAPNSGNKDGWAGMDVAYVLDLVRSIKKQYNIKYTLLNGASAGGHFALYLGINNYKDFDAISTFMGLSITSLGNYTNFQTESKNKLPILLIHGTKDKLIPIEYGRRNYAFLKAKNYPVTYIEEKDMIHEFYRKDNEKILSWFFKTIK